jgi:hypothetical protein
MRRLQQRAIVPTLLSLTVVAGCRRAPTVSILGSFFPAWLICLVAGIMFAALSNRLFIRFALEKEILWPVAVYPCLALLFACGLWLAIFS